MTAIIILHILHWQISKVASHAPVVSKTSTSLPDKALVEFASGMLPIVLGTKVQD
jgi:hypothetical protein